MLGLSADDRGLVMSRYQGWRHINLARAQGITKRRPAPVYGVNRPPHSTVVTTTDGYVFRYVGWLPRISGHQVNRFARSRLSKLVRQVFGDLPATHRVTGFATVEVLRILGPHQKPMDRDSLAQLTAGAVDGLRRGGYLKDDNERWSDTQYRNDGTRRDQGPMLEITIVYV